MGIFISKTFFLIDLTCSHLGLMSFSNISISTTVRLISKIWRRPFHSNFTWSKCKNICQLRLLGHEILNRPGEGSNQQFFRGLSSKFLTWYCSQMLWEKKEYSFFPWSWFHAFNLTGQFEISYPKQNALRRQNFKISVICQ